MYCSSPFNIQLANVRAVKVTLQTTLTALVMMVVNITSGDGAASEPLTKVTRKASKLAKVYTATTHAK